MVTVHVKLNEVFSGMGDVSRSGSSFSVNDKRSFDAWGNVRQGASSGDPKGRYCANLGHKQDDESGLVYMRARYYEPTSGRFISEDPGRQGTNWYVYCSNQSMTQADFSGASADEIMNLVREMLGRGLISKAFFNEFKNNRINGMRELIHDLVTDEHYSKDEIFQTIKFEAAEFDSKVQLESDADVLSDLDSGLDISDLNLMEDVLIADTTTGE